MTVAPKPPKNPLQKQLEEQKFLHAIQYVEQAAGGLKKLSSSELAHLNQILLGKSSQDGEPWRYKVVKVGIPGGEVEVNVHSNPLNRAREITGDALHMAANQQPVEAACYLYSQLVLEHLFNDANRRTAVLATLWLLGNSGIQIDAHQLQAIPIGNLRNPQELAHFKAQITALI